MVKQAVVSLREGGIQSLVYAIKSIRGLTGMGLKESKELVENLDSLGPRHIKIDKAGDVLDYVNMSIKGGIQIRIVNIDSPVRKHISDELAKLVTAATLASEFDLAQGLIKLLSAHYPQEDPWLNEDEVEEETK